jgi:hypothetical protein
MNSDWIWGSNVSGSPVSATVTDPRKASAEGVAKAVRARMRRTTDHLRMGGFLLFIKGTVILLAGTRIKPSVK